MIFRVFFETLRLTVRTPSPSGLPTKKYHSCVFFHIGEIFVIRREKKYTTVCTFGYFSTVYFRY